jgi:hypothetical protein
MTRDRGVARAGVGLWVALLVGLWPHPLVFAQHEETLRGEIVDPAAYLKSGTRGPELANETYEALEGGQTLALLDDATNTLYLLLAGEPGEDPNELVYDYVNQPLHVTGTVYERGGARGLVVKSVKPDAPPEGATASSSTPVVETPPAP